MTYFETEFKRYLGIDIYQTEFNQSEGRTLLRKDNIEMRISEARHEEGYKGWIGSMCHYDIVFTADQQYVGHLGASLFSLLNINKGLNFIVHIINNGIGKEDFQKLEIIASGYKCKLVNICIDDAILEKLVKRYHFTTANYYRLFIPDCINSEKVLYLDSDTIIHGPIDDLYSIELGDSYLAAVESPGFNRHNELGMRGSSKYFNSGVMLINNAKWKKERLCERVANFIEKNPNVIYLVDQCGLNAIVDGRWIPLPPKYNQQTKFFQKKGFRAAGHSFSGEELKESMNQPIVIHYTGYSKPWYFMCDHPYRKLYWKALRQTPFKKYFPEDLTPFNIVKRMFPKRARKFFKKFL